MSKFAVFDIDGTLFRSGLYREVVYELIRMKALPSSVLAKFADKEVAWKNRTHGSAFREYELAMVEAVNESLPKLKISDMELAAQYVVSSQRDNVYFYTRHLLRRLKDRDYTLIAISGSQAELVRPFADYYGFDVWVGQTYRRGEVYFTGEITATHHGKDKLLIELMDKHQLELEGSLAVGDSSGDIEMLAMVERAIAFNPDQALTTVAQAAGWDIVIERKNISYELEKADHGYRLREAIYH